MHYDKKSHPIYYQVVYIRKFKGQRIINIHGKSYSEQSLRLFERT
jgi:hypothetical protein